MWSLDLDASLDLGCWILGLITTSTVTDRKKQKYGNKDARRCIRPHGCRFLVSKLFEHLLSLVNRTRQEFDRKMRDGNKEEIWGVYPDSHWSELHHLIPAQSEPHI